MPELSRAVKRELCGLTTDQGAAAGVSYWRDLMERDGYCGDPAVKASLPILPGVGVWIRLTQNLDKADGFHLQQPDT